MNIGKLRHRVKLCTSNTSADDYGQQSLTWGTSAIVWGNVQPLKERELMNAQQAQSEATTRITIRHSSDVTNITTGDKIIYDGRSLEIVEIINPDERDIQLQFLCKEIS